jgi:hypothetical protein
MNKTNALMNKIFILIIMKTIKTISNTSIVIIITIKASYLKRPLKKIKKKKVK